MRNYSLILPKNDHYPDMEIRVINEAVAAGSFCSVSKAEAVATGEIVALKKSKIRLGDDYFKFLDNTAYVPRVLYRGESRENEPYLFVEEWINGVTLFDLTTDDSIYDSMFANISVQLLINLCDLFYKKRIYHGDLTPSNILWCENHKSNKLFILDFDPWYLVDKENIVNTYDISGSMPFLPPEYISGNLRFNGEKAMTYCAGAVLYYIRYGCPPYCEQFDTATTRRLMFGPKAENKETVDKVQRTDFRKWKQHLKNADCNMLRTQPNALGKALEAMLSLSPESRPNLETATTLVIDSFKVEVS